MTLFRRSSLQVSKYLPKYLPLAIRFTFRGLVNVYETMDLEKPRYFSFMLPDNFHPPSKAKSKYY